MNRTMPIDTRKPAQSVVGRYALYDVIASGGMATVHFGRLVGAVGFTKTVAIKRLHPHMAENPEFVRMLLDEARLAARVQHPNVVATLDVVVEGGEVLIVLEYIHGESLFDLMAAVEQRGLRAPPQIVSAIGVNALHGLQAAHDALDEHGMPLGLVHRDVSPQNVLVGVDGVARVLDFGVAKARGRLQSTQGGQLKGKLAYMAPEQVDGREVDGRTDVYAAGTVIWGALTGQRLVQGRHEGELLARVMNGNFPPPSSVAAGIGPGLDAVVMRGLAYDPNQRFNCARDMALALEYACKPASPFEVSEWVKAMAAEALAMRAARVREMESRSDVRVSIHEAAAVVVVESPFAAGSPYDPNHSGVLPGGTHVVPQRAPHDDGDGPPSKLTPPPTQALPIPAPPAWPATYTIPLAIPVPAPSAPLPPPAAASGPHAVSQLPSEVEETGSHPALIALLSVLVTTILVIVGYVYYTHRGSQTAPASPSASTAPVPTDVSAPVATLPSPPEPAPPDPAPSAGASAAPSAVADPRSSAAASATARPTTRRPKKPNCDNPFYVDSEGIKQIRPECM
jgi:eukaryotic-like serine/threonine-protein kinase